MGIALVIIHFRLGFPMTNQQFWGTPMTIKAPYDQTGRLGYDGHQLKIKPMPRRPHGGESGIHHSRHSSPGAGCGNGESSARSKWLGKIERPICFAFWSSGSYWLSLVLCFKGVVCMPSTNPSFGKGDQTVRVAGWWALGLRELVRTMRT